MPPPSFSIPARITVPRRPPGRALQPSARAASAASRAISADFSAASAARSPLFPLPTRRGPRRRRCRARRAGPRSSPRSCPSPGPPESRNRSYSATSRSALSSSGRGSGNLVRQVMAPAAPIPLLFHYGLSFISSKRPRVCNSQSRVDTTSNLTSARIRCNGSTLSRAPNALDLGIL